MRGLTRTARSLIRSGLCLVLVVVMALGPHVLQYQLCAQDSGRHTATSEPSAEQLKELADRLERIFDALEEAHKEIPRDTFDPQVIVHGQPEAGLEGVGTDAEKLFNWVRDQTNLVPYRGVLRDYRGVLMDRVGNSLDRALLLLILLYKADHKRLRLAHAELPEDKAEELLDGMRSIPPQGALPRRDASLDGQLQELARYADQYGLDQGKLRRAIHRMNLKSQRLAEEAVQRTFEQTQIIIEMLDEKGLVPSRAEQVARERENAIKALRHHWWVQWHNGSKWLDLDPSLPDAKPGAPLVPMQEIVPGNKLSELLANERHTAQIRLVIERWVNGRLVEVPVLTQELFPAAFLGERIAIHHAPRHWPEDLDLFEAEEPLEALKDTVLAQREWVPVLTVGNARISKYSFTDTGQINDPTLPGFVQNVLAGRQLSEAVEEGIQEVANDIGKGIATGRIGGIGLARPTGPDNYDAGASRGPETNETLQPPATKGPAQLTAEWIEYEIRVPGEDPQQIRRQIFDLLGPAARQTARATMRDDERVSAPEFDEQQQLNRSLALLGQTDILPLVGQVSPEHVGYLHVQNLLDNRKPMLGLLRNAPSQDLNALMQQATELTPIPGRLYGLALSRAEWSGQRGDVYLDRLNILSFHQYMRIDPVNDMLAGNAFDIVANGVAVSPDSSANSFLLRLEQGVLDTNTEALLLATSGTVDNVAELFAMTNVQGPEWQIVETPDDPALRRADLSADARARVEHDLVSGFVVVAPASVVEFEGRYQFGWWRVDPVSGASLGIGERGWGQTATEILLKLAVIKTGQLLLLICILDAIPDAGPPRDASVWRALYEPGRVVFDLAWCSIGFYRGLPSSLTGRTSDLVDALRANLEALLREAQRRWD